MNTSPLEVLNVSSISSQCLPFPRNNALLFWSLSVPWLHLSPGTETASPQDYVILRAGSEESLFLCAISKGKKKSFPKYFAYGSSNKVHSQQDTIIKVSRSKGLCYALLFYQHPIQRAVTLHYFNTGMQLLSFQKKPTLTLNNRHLRGELTEALRLLCLLLGQTSWPVLPVSASMPVHLSYHVVGLPHAPNSSLFFGKHQGTEKNTRDF